MLVLSASKADYRAAVMAVALDTETKIRNVAEQVGIETIDYLRSLTSEMRPPAKVGEGARQAHPGGWADVTGLLAGAYQSAVEPIPGGWRLVLSNTMEYAAHLEAHDGYFVLSGVADPGGPVYEVLQRVAAEVAPTWEVRLQGVKRLELQGPEQAGSQRAPGGGI